MSRTAGKTIARSQQAPSSGGNNNYLAHPPPSSGSGSGSEESTGSEDESEEDGRPEGYLYSSAIPQPTRFYGVPQGDTVTQNRSTVAGYQNDRASSEEHSGSEEDSDFDDLANNIENDLGSMGRGGKGGKGQRAHVTGYGGSNIPPTQRRTSGMDLQTIMSWVVHPTSPVRISIADRSACLSD